MKTLFLAVAGLASFGLAGAAFGQTCADTNLSAWSSTFTNNSTALHVVATGLEATPSACKMSATLGANVASGQQNAAAIVIDSTPGNAALGEPRYRVRFYFNIDAVTGTPLDATIQSTLLNVVGLNASQGFNQIMRVLSRGNSSHQHVIRLAAACGTNSPTSDGLCRADIINVAAGNHYLELDIQTGASGYVTYWLDSNATSTAGTSIASNAGTTMNMTPWGGVVSASMGISNTSPNYRLNFGTATQYFDAFDSRRQTAIGP